MAPVEKAVLAIIVACLILIGFGTYDTVTVEEPKQYAVWVKTSGNPQHLTFEEWKTQKRMEEEKRRQTVTVFAPLNR